jgi:myxalamid-type polyketide synthase MxaE and MxaD
MAASGSPWKIAEAPSKSTTLHDSLRRLNDLAHLPGSYFWEIELSSQGFPYLRDHRIQGVIVLPGTAYLGIAQAGADEICGAGAYFLQDVEFHKVLFLPEDGTRKVQLIFSPNAHGETAFQIYSQSRDTGRNPMWILHATGNISLKDKTKKA